MENNKNGLDENSDRINEILDSLKSIGDDLVSNINEADNIISLEEDFEKNDLKKLSRNLLSKIERIPQFEEKLGIKYENISIILKESFSGDPFCLSMEIAGDVFEVDKEKIDKNGSIITTATIYDSENYILYTGNHTLYVEDFLGFDNFDIITTATIYDSENYILYTGNHTLYVEDFLGFDNFDIYVGEISVEEISKIRIFPK